VDWRKLGYDSWVVNRRKLMIVDDAGYCVGQGEVVIETEDPGRGSTVMLFVQITSFVYGF